MRVLVSTVLPDADPGAAIEFTDFDTAIGSADYLTLHSRAGKGDPLIDRASFAAMKNSANIINTACGSLVDEAALVTALESGEIAGAELDVMQQEPIAEDNPLRRMSSVLITSHLAGQAPAHRHTPISIAQKTPSCHKQLDIYRLHSGLEPPQLSRCRTARRLRDPTAA